ncbi:MAG TPA: DUF2339 domain-containing protein [Gemmatimonadales bacterium]|nr:DUF2339 domain-containing protein [Gemmatimonadales bacterium]
MSVDDRLDRLEQRMTVLETLVRGLAGAGAWEQAAVGASGREPLPSSPPAPEPIQAVPPVPPVPPSVSRPFSSVPARSRPFEQWIGQRGLLAVGVFALILAAGYLLKLSFDRGWISPAMRCAGGVLGGIAVGAIGWRLHERYRTYGSALIGCGSGIIYLSVWAAARLYGFFPPTTGIAALALISLSLAAIAYAIDIQALGLTAVVGAFVAPVLLGRERANADLLLLYLGCMAAALGWVAARRRWRLTMFAIAASFFGLGWTGVAQSRRPDGALLYAVLGGAGGVWVGLRHRWWETRFLAFWGGWGLLATVAEQLHPRSPVFVGGLVLAAPVWLHGLRQRGRWSPGEALYFFATPILLGWAVETLAPGVFAPRDWLAPLLIAIPYLAVGYATPRPAFAFVGAAALAVAVMERWSGLEATVALLGLSPVWAALDHARQRSDGRWYAIATLALALLHLFQADAPLRDYHDSAFIGAWAGVQWLAIGLAVALAAGLWKREPATNVTKLVGRGLWLVAGALTLFGVTEEIQRYFRLRAPTQAAATLASGLSVSAWWLAFAAALVVLGLRRAIRELRLAGLGVAGLAVLKVLIFDLASLDALYRVASVFILGLVSLLLAYLYHRQARNPGSEPT